MDKSVRWRQRYQNFSKAHATLSEGVQIDAPNKFEQQGIIQCFEFTFELAWKTLKDFLESQQVLANYPRDVIKEAFKHEIVEDGELWMEMLEQRNLMSHTYNEENAKLALKKIRSVYLPAITQVINYFKSQE